MLTAYHAKLFAHEISRRHVSSDLEKFIPTLMGARVDLNPHQIDAALFAFRSPLTDGKGIQDLNIDEIASIRRNPVMCDIFSRLKLMERRGSGLRKIIDQYPEDTVPSFRSTEQAFVVTLKNLNYGVVSTPRSDETGVDNGDDIGAKGNADLILTTITEEPKITQKELALKTGLSTRTISREIQGLRDAGAIRRIGSDRLGHWDIVKP